VSSGRVSDPRKALKKLHACLTHLLDSAGQPTLMSEPLTATPCNRRRRQLSHADHHGGSPLDGAAERNLSQLDEKLYFEALTPTPSRRSADVNLPTVRAAQLAPPGPHQAVADRRFMGRARRRHHRWRATNHPSLGCSFFFVPISASWLTLRADRVRRPPQTAPLRPRPRASSSEHRVARVCVRSVVGLRQATPLRPIHLISITPLDWLAICSAL
jgi:hypothetical protein